MNKYFLFILIMDLLYGAILCSPARLTALLLHVILSKPLHVAKASLTSIQGVKLQTYFNSYISHDLQGMSVWEDLSVCTGVLMLIHF